MCIQHVYIGYIRLVMSKKRKNCANAGSDADSAHSDLAELEPLPQPMQASVSSSEGSEGDPLIRLELVCGQ